MSAEAWEDPLRTTRTKHLDQLSADKGENDASIARLEDEKDLVLRALGGALARKSAQEAKIVALSEHGGRLGDCGAETEKSRAPRRDASGHRRATTMTLKFLQSIFNQQRGYLGSASDARLRARLQSSGCAPSRSRPSPTTQKSR